MKTLFNLLEENRKGITEESVLKLVQKDTCSKKNEIRSYLLSGKTAGVVLGCVRSFDGTNLSIQPYTDGNWIWPEYLVYFIEKYNISLPKEFMDHAQSNNGQVPELTEKQIACALKMNK